MLRFLLVPYTLLLISCSKPSLALKSECWDREYIVEDLGQYVTLSDFDVSFDCEYGTVLILDEVGSTQLYREGQLLPDFEMEIDFFPGEFEIIFKSGEYWFRAIVVIDSDRRMTTIHEVSNYCGGGCD